MLENKEASTTAKSLSNDNLPDKLIREAYVVGGGTLSGVADNLRERAQHPWGTIAEVAVAYGIGCGLARAQVGAATVRLGAEVAGGALTYSFLSDVNGRGSQLWRAAVDTWKTPENREGNFSTVANTMGSFSADLLLSGVAGMSGAKAGLHANDVASFRSSPTTASFERSIADLSTWEKGKSAGGGTAFFYNKTGGMLTASHCLLEPNDGITVRLADGQVVEARLKAALPGRDIALLETDVKSRPLRLMKDLSQLTDDRKAVSIGFPQKLIPTKGPHLEFGHFDRLTTDDCYPEPSPIRGAIEKLIKPITSMLDSDVQDEWWEGRPVVWFEGKIKGGMSGGPLIDRMTGKVIGINQSRYDDYLKLPAVAAPADDARRLIGIVYRALKPGSAVGAEEAAKTLGTSIDDVVDMANQGKLDGFWLPKDNSFDFEDPSSLRILKDSVKKFGSRPTG